MLSGLLEFYKEYQHMLLFKGTSPGQDSMSKVSELALVGDKYIGYRIASELIKLGMSNSDITMVMSFVLSNANLSEIANVVGLPTGPKSHANGTLLEAMVGVWILASHFPESMDVFCKHQDTMEMLIKYLREQCENRHRNKVMHFFSPPNSTSQLESDG